eukprot:g15455.t1
MTERHGDGLLTQQQLMSRLIGIQANVDKAKEAVAALDFKEAVAEVHQLAIWSGHLMDDMAAMRNTLDKAAQDKEKADPAPKAAPVPAQEEESDSSSSSSSSVEIADAGTQTNLSGKFRLGAVLQSWGKEHRLLDLASGKPEFKLAKVVENVEAFKEKVKGKSAAELANEAKPTADSIMEFPRQLMDILKQDFCDDERRGGILLSVCVRHAKALLLQKAIQGSSPVAADPATIPAGLFGQDQWTISAAGASSPTGSGPSPTGSTNSGEDPSMWAEASPDTLLPESVCSALGPQLAAQVDAFRKNLIRSSVKPATEKAYMSTLGRALAMASIPWSALPVRDVNAYGLLIARLYGVAKSSDKFTVKDVGGVPRVKWSFFASFKAALKFYHESRLLASDFGEIACAPEILRMFTAIKKDSHREVENPKEKITLGQLIEINNVLISKHYKVWKSDDLDELKSVGVEALTASADYNSCNLVRQLASDLRNALAFRIGFLAERRKSELTSLLGDSVEVQADESLILQVIRGKTEFSRGDLACGRKAVVPNVPTIRPSPAELLKALNETKEVLRAKWTFTDPPPKVGPDAKKEFHAQHGTSFGNVGEPTLQKQRYVMCSFDHIGKKFNMWNGPALSHAMAKIFNGGSLSLTIKNPSRVSLRSSGATLFARTSRQAAIMNAGWASSLMSYTTYAQLTPEQLAHASKRCLLVEARGTVVTKAVAEVRFADKPRSAALAIYKCDTKMRVCSLLAEIVETWHLLSFKRRSQVVSIKMRGFLCFCGLFDVLLFSDAKPPLEPDEIDRLNKLFNLRQPELDQIAEREVDAYFANQKKKLFTQKAVGQYAEAFLGETVELEARDSTGKAVKKSVPMPRSKADVCEFLQAQEGPRDIFRSREDRAAADALTMCPEHAFLAEVPLETRKQWFGGFRLEFVEDADQEVVTASWTSGKPVFSMDDFPSIQLDLEASRKELLRIVQIGKAIRWDSLALLPPGFSVAPANLIVRDHRNRYVNDWTIAGLNPRLRPWDTNYGCMCQLVALVVVGAFFWGLDVSDSFFHWMLHPSVRRLFGINLPSEGGAEAKAQLLFAAMGLAVSPGINDYSIKACIQAFLRFDSSLCVVDFVDDLRGTSRGVETSFRKVYLGMQKFRFFIRRLGIVLHDFRPEKLDKMIFPTRAIDWIGFAVDSVAMTVSIDKERLVKAITSLDNYIRACQDTHLTTAKELASIVGKLSFLVFIVRLGRRCLRTSYDAMGASGAILQWTRGRKNFNPTIHVSKAMIEDWEWWIKVLRNDPRLPILVTDKGQAYLFTPELLDYPDVFKDMKASDVAIVTTDASRLGWGYSVDDDTSRGFAPWEFDGAKKSSNYRELFTVQKVLESGENFGGRRFLFLRTDNTTTRHYVNAGSGKCPDLAKIAGDIIQVCLSRGLVLIASHIAGKANVIADALSRLWLNSTITDSNPNKRLNPRVLNAVQKRIGLKITFDMLCSRGGVNSLTGNDYYDYRTNAFSVTADETGEAFGHVLWWRPSLDMLHVTVKHLISFMTKAADERIMALVLVPKMNSRFAFLYAKLHKLTRLKKGGLLFQDTKDGTTWHDLPPVDYPYLILATMSREDITLQLAKRQARCEEARQKKMTPSAEASSRRSELVTLLQAVQTKNRANNFTPASRSSEDLQRDEQLANDLSVKMKEPSANPTEPGNIFNDCGAVSIFEVPSAQSNETELPKAKWRPEDLPDRGSAKIEHLQVYDEKWTGGPTSHTYLARAVPQSFRTNLENFGVEYLHPVQHLAYKHIFAGKSMLLSAPPSSGKTLAYLLPTLWKCTTTREEEDESEWGPKRSGFCKPEGLSEVAFKDAATPRAVIVVPTRESADAVHMEARRFLMNAKAPLRTCKVLGGVAMEEEVEDLATGCDLLIGTMGRLREYIDARGILRLNKCQLVVFDDSARFFTKKPATEPEAGTDADLGDALYLWRETTAGGKRPPTVIMTGTNLGPKDFDFAVREMGVDSKKLCLLQVSAVQNAAGECVSGKNKYRELDSPTSGCGHAADSDIGSKCGRVVVFCDTIVTVDKLCEWLKAQDLFLPAPPAASTSLSLSSSSGSAASTPAEPKRIPIERLHSQCGSGLGTAGSSTSARRAVVRKWRDEPRMVVLTSDVARSLHIEGMDINLVINFDLPYNVQEFEERCGRSGRVPNANNKGSAIQLVPVTPDGRIETDSRTLETLRQIAHNTTDPRTVTNYSAVDDVTGSAGSSSSWTNFNYSSWDTGASSTSRADSSWNSHEQQEANTQQNNDVADMNISGNASNAGGGGGAGGTQDDAQDRDYLDLVWKGYTVRQWNAHHASNGELVWTEDEWKNKIFSSAR